MRYRVFVLGVVTTIALASSSAAESRDKTLSRHGNLRLFLTGSCGPDDAGRQAVVENRSPHQAVSAEVETAVWSDGRIRSTTISRLSLEPLEEERLGCTHRSGGTERRYAIVRTSNASAHRIDHQPTAPKPGKLFRSARSAVAIVDAGTCGQGRAGTSRSVINRHGSREVSVSIEVRELVDGKTRRTYVKNHRLAPGATRRLGCGADGPLTRRFTVLEASYR